MYTQTLVDSTDCSRLGSSVEKVFHSQEDEITTSTSSYMFHINHNAIYSQGIQYINIILTCPQCVKPQAYHSIPNKEEHSYNFLRRSLFLLFGSWSDRTRMLGVQSHLVNSDRPLCRFPFIPFVDHGTFAPCHADECPDRGPDERNSPA